MLEAIRHGGIDGGDTKVTRDQAKDLITAATFQDSSDTGSKSGRFQSHVAKWCKNCEV